MARAWICLVLAAGCDEAFGLERPPIDGSLDGLTDPCWSSVLTTNEDGDGMVDGCDECPADPEATVRNSDGDGLGDPCDPHAGSDQRIVTFDGFETPGQPWTAMSGSWPMSNGTYTQLDPTGETRSGLAIVATARPGVEVLFEGLAMVDFARAGAYVLVGASDTEVMCRFQVRSGSDRVLLHVDGTEVGNAILDAPSTIRLRLHQDTTGAFHCKVFRGSVMAMELVSPPLLETVSTRVGLVTSDTSATFRSFLVYSTQ